MPNEPLPSDDPLDLDSVDRDIRINELEEQARNVGMTSHFVSEDCPDEAHEQFLRDMLHFEHGPRSSRFEQLTSAGVDLPPPESMDDSVLHTKLWEVIQALAEHDVFLSHTDHLSDRQLYEDLWTSLLREQVTIMPPGSGWRCHLDVLGGCSEEDIEIGLRYYDDEKQRQHWAEEFPEDFIPPHEDPPYDRDRHLPVAREEYFEFADDDDEDDDGEDA